MLLPYSKLLLPSLLGHHPLTKSPGSLFHSFNNMLLLLLCAMCGAGCPGYRYEAGMYHSCPGGTHSPGEAANEHVDMKSQTVPSSPRERHAGRRSNRSVELAQRVSTILQIRTEMFLKALFINSLENNNNDNNHCTPTQITFFMKNSSISQTR